jgi:hypothetical protein
MRVIAGTRLVTGDICNQSGLWSALQNRAVRTVRTGDPMPRLNGRAVVWELIRAD